MRLTKSKRARKPSAARRAKTATRSLAVARHPRTRATRSSRALRSAAPSVFARFDSTAGAVAIGLLVLGVVAGALAIAPRTSVPQPPIAARDIHADEPLSPLADPGRVPDAKSVADAALVDSTAAAAPVVTITGCLERDAAAFRLQDTSGASAPTRRSWKSGFLRKGPASIQVLDGSSAVRLPEHVGQRVSVTGPLVDRAMKVRSLQPIAASCNRAPRA
jgi:hypothetical protein